MASSWAAVIGAGWGDEGKGLLTDYLCRLDTLNVRFNGGAQAGHTVVTPEGRRHTFHHFGAGSFRGARTFLSQYFLVNPILFRQELHALIGDHRSKGGALDVDGRALITTPYDMMLNQAIEAKRGAAKHGSVGAGIHETVVRSHDHPLYALTVAEAKAFPLSLKRRLERLRESYVPMRAAALGLSLDELPHLTNDAVLAQWLDDLAFFLDQSTVTWWEALTPTHVVFEGAQGLSLDAKSPDFPYVTCSRTGLTNVLTLMTTAHVPPQAPLDVVYVTRAYATRHGAGPFPTELPALSFPDATNVPNKYQGLLRFGALDLTRLHTNITTDLAQVAATRVEVRPSVAVTCLDQLESTIPLVIHGATLTTRPQVVPFHVATAAKLPIAFVSRGPSRTTVEDLRANVLSVA